MSIGFIILRHVRSVETNRYWNLCYRKIREYYLENSILIIDDNSAAEHVSAEQELTKTTVIHSEYPGRGELLPYIYYLSNPLFRTAVILHDSVFLNQYTDFSVDKYRFIWDFGHGSSDHPQEETSMLRLFNDQSLLDFYWRRHGWVGCFGGMSIITHDFLVTVNRQYNLRLLLPVIRNRTNRMELERVIACLLQKVAPQTTLLCDIKDYCQWGIPFNRIGYCQHLPIIKCWTGR